MTRRAYRWLLLSAILVVIGCGPGSATTTATSDAASTCDASACASSGAGSSSGVASTGPTSAGTAGSSSHGSGSTTGASTTETSTCEPASQFEETDCDFICRVDVASDVECDVLAQDCPCGQKCLAYDGEGVGYHSSIKCFDLTGNGQLGDPCIANPIADGGDDCGPGLMCWYLQEDGSGECIALCTGKLGGPFECPVGSNCYIEEGGVLSLCIPECDPLLQDCGPGQVCVLGNGYRFSCAPDWSGDTGGEGAPCEGSIDCGPGLICTPEFSYPSPSCGDSNGCCTPFCDLTNGEADCQGLSVEGATCVAYFEEGQAPEGHEDVGVCGLP